MKPLSNHKRTKSHVLFQKTDQTSKDNSISNKRRLSLPKILDIRLSRDKHQFMRKYKHHNFLTNAGCITERNKENIYQ